VNLQNGTCTTITGGARFQSPVVVVVFATLRLHHAEAEASPRNICDEVRVARCFPLYRRFTGIRCSIQSKSDRGAKVYGGVLLTFELLVDSTKFRGTYSDTHTAE